MPNYNDTPQGPQRINDTQPLIRENFNSIDAAWQINHVDIETAVHFGKHIHCSFPEQGADPATADNEGAVYTKEGAITTVSELCFRRETSGDVVEMTANYWDAGTETGWTYLPSGLLVKFGLIRWTAGDGAQNVFLLPVNANTPVFTSGYNCQLTLANLFVGAFDAMVQLVTFTSTRIDYRLGKLSAYADQPTDNLGIYYYMTGV